MKHMDIGSMLVRLKKHMPVSSELKRNFRKNPAVSNRNLLVRRIPVLIAAALIFATLIVPVPNDMHRISAADLPKQKPCGADTVINYLQALIARDDGYASGLLKTAPEGPLTVSNPHYIGYNILASGNEGGKEYVDAESYLQYTANPYYQIIKSRYYLVQSDGGYLIENIEQLSQTEVYEKGGTIYRNSSDSMNSGANDGGEKEILRDSDIPFKHLPSGIYYRFSNLVYSEKSQLLIMAIQLTNEVDVPVWLKLLSYDAANNRFDLIDEIKAPAVNIGAEGLSIDPNGKYLTADIFYEDDKGTKKSVIVYDLQNKVKSETDR